MGGWGAWRAYPYLSEKGDINCGPGVFFLRANLKTTLREDHKAVKPFGRMVALVRIKGATRQRGLELRLRDLGKIWVSGFGPSEPAAASSTLR